MINAVGSKCVLAGSFLLSFQVLTVGVSDSLSLSFILLFFSVLFSRSTDLRIVVGFLCFLSISTIFLLLSLYLGPGISVDIKRIFSFFYIQVYFVVILLACRGYSFLSRRMLSYFLMGLLLNASLALLDFLSYLIFRVPIIPINLMQVVFGFDLPRFAVHFYNEVGFYRPGGLFGEPKILGLFAVVGLIIIKFVSIKSLIVRYSSYAILGFSIFVSASTSALILLVVYSFSLLISYSAVYRWRKIVALGLVLSIFTSAVVFLFVMNADSYTSQYGSIEQITGFTIIDRSLRADLLEDFDLLSLRALQSSLSNALIGYGAVFGNLSLVDSDYADLWVTPDNYFVAKSGLFFILSFFGFFGFLLVIIVWYISISKKEFYFDDKLLHMFFTVYFLFPCLFLLRAYLMYALVFCAILIFQINSKRIVRVKAYV